LVKLLFIFVTLQLCSPEVRLL